MTDRETADTGKAIEVAQRFMLELNNQVRHVGLGIGNGINQYTDAMENESVTPVGAGEIVVTETLNACRNTAMESCETMAGLLALYQDDHSKEWLAEYFAEYVVAGLKGSFFRVTEGDHAILLKKVIEKLNQ